MQFTPQAQKIILAAGKKARRFGHSFVGTVHLLLSLAEEGVVTQQLLKMAGFRLDTAETMVKVLYGYGTPDLPLPQGFSRQMRRVLRGPREEAVALKNRQVTDIHILLSLF